MSERRIGFMLGICTVSILLVLYSILNLYNQVAALQGSLNETDHNVAALARVIGSKP